MKIALAQLNYHVGNIPFNVSKIIDRINLAKQQGADLVVFSELSVCGYPPNDFLEIDYFIDNCLQGVQTIAKECVGIAAIVGAPSINEKPSGKILCNSAYFLADGKVESIYNKGLLPTYDIFDEYRYFEPCATSGCIKLKNTTIALTVCEDLWDEFAQKSYRSSYKKMYHASPVEHLMKQNPELIINIAASPFSYSHKEERLAVLQKNAIAFKLPLIYVNQVGANTDLVFDGGSLVLNEAGEISAELKHFEEDFKLIDTNALKGSKETFLIEPKIERIYQALILGIRDYFSKSGFNKAILGLSGGIDSAVTAALAIEALGAKNVHCVLLPSPYSSDHSVNDAFALVNNTSCLFYKIEIGGVYDALLTSLQDQFLGTEFGLAEENLQARSRGIVLMALSNKFGSILLNTSNKSELAVGYGTLYGDMCGGLSVIGDVYKSEVFELAKYINRTGIIIPENTISKPPSAELRPNQKDTDSLPEYELLDKILYEYIENRNGPLEIKSKGYDASLVDRVMKLVNSSEYKRNQFAPILRVSDKSFGVGRKMPIVAKYF